VPSPQRLVEELGILAARARVATSPQEDYKYWAEARRMLYWMQNSLSLEEMRDLLALLQAQFGNRF
jgi:hypothetical protein